MAAEPNTSLPFSTLGEHDPYDALVGEISFVRHRKPDPAWAINEIVNRRYYILGFAASGKAQYECGDQRFSVGKGHLLFFPRGMPHSGASDPKAPWSFYSTAFELQFPGEMQASAFGSLPNHAVTKNQLEVTSLFSELERLWIAREPGFLLRCRSVLFQLLHVYVRCSTGPVTSVPHARRILPIVRLLQENLAESYTVEELAEQADLSPSRFRVLFKQLSGHPVVRYQNWLRVNKAKDLLLSGEYSVTEAARQVGFDDVYYFSRLFKKLTGFNPSYYRNR